MKRKARTPGTRRVPLALVPVLLATVVLCAAVGLVSGAILAGFARGFLDLDAVRVSLKTAGDVPVSPTPRVPTLRPSESVLRFTPVPSRPPLDICTPGPGSTAPPTAVMWPDVSAGQTGETSVSRDTSPQTPVRQPSLRGLPANQPLRPATRLVIPSLGVDAPVVLLGLRNGTWPVDHITHEVGHLQGTASPGDISNAVMAGHATLAQGGDGPFRNLALLKQGDEIRVYAGDDINRFVVERIEVVSPEDVEVVMPTEQPTLTLITCARWDQALHVYDERIVAVARLAP